jgi:AcrR family transcriptional regulator
MEKGAIVTDSEIKNRILEGAKEYYFHYGFSKSTMDDFAHRLGMSKKTIYKLFPSKDDIVRHITRDKINTIHSCCRVLQSDKSLDFIERLKRITGYISNEMQSLKPSFYSDIQRTMPDLWKEIEGLRRELVFKDFGQMMREGIEIGVFRKDINVDVLVLMYANAMESIINPETLSTLPLNAAQAYDAIVDIVFGGVFTPQAKEKYLHSQPVSTVIKEDVHQ